MFKEKQKFKIGDKVQLLDVKTLSATQKKYLGKKMTIRTQYDGANRKNYYTLIEMNGGHYGNMEEELTFARVAANKLSRKLYPDYEEKDGYLYFKEKHE